MYIIRGGGVFRHSLRCFGLHFCLRKFRCVFEHFYACTPKATKFGEINKGHYAVQGHSRSFKVTDIGTNRKLICDFLLVINTSLSPILHRFRDTAFHRSKIPIFGYLLVFLARTERFPWDDIRKNLHGCQRMAKVQNGVKS